jgi:hypothetical protein
MTSHALCFVEILVGAVNAIPHNFSATCGGDMTDMTDMADMTDICAGVSSLAQLFGKNNEQMGHHLQADGPAGQFGAIYSVIVPI